MTPGFTYVGSELDLFSEAKNWKSYFRDQLSPYLGEDVLEVGAGLGGTTRVLCRGSERRWVCLEPDASLAARLEREIRSGSLPGSCETRVGTLEGFDPSETFDTILYMDVLEHIEDDKAEVARAARHLRPGGHVIALSPAHQWLFTPFDEAIGHHRRYSRAGFGALATEGPGDGPAGLPRLDRLLRLAGQQADPQERDAEAFADRVLGSGPGPDVQDGRPDPRLLGGQVGPGGLAEDVRLRPSA